MTRIKKSISFLLALVLAFTSTLPTYASEEPIAEFNESVIESEVYEETEDNSEFIEETLPEILVKDSGDVSLNLPEEPVDEDHKAHKLTVKISNTAGGSVSYTVRGKALSDVTAGETVSLKYTAKTSSYYKAAATKSTTIYPFHIDRWTTTAGTVEFADPTAVETTFVMPDEDVDVVLTYNEDPYFLVLYSPGTNATTTTAYTAKKYYGYNITLRGKTYTCKDPQYTQCGWSLDPAGTTKDYDLSFKYYDVDEAGHTLYPYFGINHSVKIIPDENCVESDEYEYLKNAGVSLTLPGTLYTNKDSSANVRQYGWDVVSGWDTSMGDEPRITTAFTYDNSDYVLKPHWENIYKVTYLPDDNCYGINGDDEVFSYIYEDTPEDRKLLSSMFIRPGYSQTGWSLTKGGSKKYSVGAQIDSPGKDIILYPYWLANHTITYKPGAGNEGETIIDEKRYGITYYTRGITYYKNGCIQSGWNTAQNSTTAKYAFGGSFTSEGNYTFYPSWTYYEYPIYVNNIQVTGHNADDVLGDGKVYYDSQKNVLRLTDLSVNCIDGPYIEIKDAVASGNLVALSEVNIECIGDCSIVSDAKGISSEIPVNLSGNLDISANDTALQVYSYTKPKLNISSGDVVLSSKTQAIKMWTNVFPEYEFPVIGYCGISKENAEKLPTSGSYLPGVKYASFVNADLTKEEGVVFAYVGDTAVTKDSLSGPGYEYAIESNTLKINNSEITEYTTVNGKTYAIYSAYDLNVVFDGANTIGNSENYPDYVVFSSRNLTISGDGVAEVYGGRLYKATEDITLMGSTVIASLKSTVIEGVDISIIGGTINANTSGDAITANSMYVSEGTININAGKHGIALSGDCLIEGGKITVQSDLTAFCCNLYNQFDGEVKFVSTSDCTEPGIDGSAIYGFNAKDYTKIYGGSLEAEAQYNAAFAENYLYIYMMVNYQQYPDRRMLGEILRARL